VIIRLWFDQRRKMRTRRYLILSVLLLGSYPLLYVGARASHLLVRTLENSDPTYSSRVIPGRGIIQFFLGEPSWHLFYPAHRCETWYRNRPEYRYRHYKRRVEQSAAPLPSAPTGPSEGAH
jgi:hypothetical protein